MPHASRTCGISLVAISQSASRLGLRVHPPTCAFAFTAARNGSAPASARLGRRLLLITLDHLTAQEPLNLIGRQAFMLQEPLRQAMQVVHMIAKHLQGLVFSFFYNAAHLFIDQSRRSLGDVLLACH